MGAVIFRIILALVTLAILGFAIASSFYIFAKVEKPKVDAVRELKVAEPPKPIDPGIGEFRKAVALVEEREWVAAREQLRHIIRYFPESERYQPARKLCSEINLDMIVSPDVLDRKESYEVKSGDAVIRIATKHNTTLEYLKRVNGLMDFRIRPGDQFMLRALDFEVEVRSEERRLILKEEGEFFAEFGVLDVRLPGGVRLPHKDEIKGRTAWVGSSSIKVTDSGYDEARKQLRLGRRGLSLTSLREDDGEESGSSADTGIFIDREAMEELNMLLRVGTPVHIVP